MTKLTTQQVRNTFIDFFKAEGHTHVPSSSLVPHNDPSLMFVNSGMVQFKDVFTGVEKRDYSKATSSQKSVRAGGKHNDLDNVGYTARHHTFFEMLGNFSFGNYFKEEAIYYAWNLLTKDFALDKNKLYVTVYHDDEEAASYWKKIAGFSDDRIIRISTNDNFWSMGDTGPCGPCSEVFYDHGAHIPGGLPGTPEEDGDRFIEIWNLVFMQYEQVDKDTRINLPNQSVDTGMGLERISAVIQGVHDNYDIDLFQDIIGYTESILKVKPQGEALFSYRVIADHLRSASFLIADGVMPSNEGRGYVLRRIMRRAMRHAHQLGAQDPLMYKLLPKLVDLFGHAYPEIKRAEDFVSSILQQEEERFKKTLDRGLKLLEEESVAISKGGKLSGEVAFKLYDTYGFPLDLTEDILKKQKVTVDNEEFDKQMLAQKERARKAWVGSGESKTDAIWFDISAEFGATDFLGYSLNIAEAKVISLVQEGAKLKQISKVGTKFTLIANQTPFYGESGGQMGDIGVITSPHCKIKVINTMKYLGKVIGHVCELKEGLISPGDEIKLEIDTNYRKNLRIHHTATHILHAVLRDVLGRHVTQKGSLVAQDKLRFDISHPKALMKAEIHLIESKVNHIISDNSKVNTKLMSTDQAIESGAMALFGEKYDSEVRVVSLGSDFNDLNPYSFELCGGTHAQRTGDIGAFKIISEGAIAAGIRRIEAVCGDFAFTSILESEELLDQVMNSLKANKTELLQKVETLVGSKKDLERQVEKLQMDSITLSDKDLAKQIVAINDARLVYREFDKIDPKIIRMSAENLVKKHDDLIVVYISKNAGKLAIVVAVSNKASNQYNAGNIANKTADFVGGSGGGQATLAQAGGIDLSKLPQLKSKVEEIVAQF
ncbi:MAG: alanine--tRNA ligase [Rickettsiaceae bacterium]|nr:alanine--tRNA ligase [Rickettsiaceae bacterium]MDP5083353.1 alanine--tRNA ligase [Rickettsiaceae bacterium]